MKTSQRLIIATIFLLLFGFSSSGISKVSISVNIPPLLFRAPPQMVVIPNTYVYFSPDVDSDIFFYHGYWYRPHEGRWYRSSSYNGRWSYIRDVPPQLLRMPPDHRRMTMEHQRIPYGDLHKNWKSWEKGKYWDKHDWGRGGDRHERDRGHERGERGDHRDRD